MIVLAMLGVVALLAGPAFRPEPLGELDQPAEYAALLQARMDAVNSGTVTQVRITRQEDTIVITLFPDGRVLGFGLVGLDPLTGRRVVTSDHQRDRK